MVICENKIIFFYIFSVGLGTGEAIAGVHDLQNVLDDDHIQKRAFDKSHILIHPGEYFYFWAHICIVNFQFHKCMHVLLICILNVCDELKK